MDPEHRKIELQSPADLVYLASKIRATARQKLDLHLPNQPNTAEPDEFRKHVENLVDAFVAEVLAGLKHNISINGIDVVSRGEGADGEAVDMDNAASGLENGVVEVEEFEPFDEKLRGHLGSAIQKRDALISKISQHRRTTPALAAQRFQEQFGQESTAFETAGMEADRVALECAGAGVAGVDGIKRQDDVERSWDRAIEGLGRLNKGLPETRARLERCGDVVAYLGADPKARV
ncbi:hypothetical protein CC80DRAFT_276954 [Byssothecium circinans]|uniref:Mis14-domain-containing protein n=1 Tax=Byssothecium circinans TaxID=147558 RepID=A0A6A5TCC0_9PLEO|nr:hypothetical protein CC80DRAFT_276954 [Byssothecium circinans]